MGALEAATVEDILDELGRRHSAMVFLAEKPSVGRDGTTTVVQFRGSINTRLGLVERAKQGVLLAMLDSEEVDDADGGH